MEDLEANSFGRESEGLWRHRGNGGLVLTGECLHFFKFLPRSDFRIPVTAITGVALTKSHLGKATIFDLLKVQFLENGRSDSVAWYVADVHAWKDRIEVARRGAE
jgi:hypothetical protein